MHLFRFLPKFLRQEILAVVAAQLNHLSDAEVAQGVDHVKAFLIGHFTEFLGL